MFLPCCGSKGPRSCRHQSVLETGLSVLKISRIYHCHQQGSICRPGQATCHSCLGTSSRVVWLPKLKITSWIDILDRQVIHDREHYLPLYPCVIFLLLGFIEVGFIQPEGPISFLCIDWLFRDSVLLWGWGYWISWCPKSHPARNLFMSHGSGNRSFGDWVDLLRLPGSGTCQASCLPLSSILSPSEELGSLCRDIIFLTPRNLLCCCSYRSSVEFLPASPREAGWNYFFWKPRLVLCRVAKFGLIILGILTVK